MIIIIIMGVIKEYNINIIIVIGSEYNIILIIIDNINR